MSDEALDNQEDPPDLLVLLSSLNRKSSQVSAERLARSLPPESLLRLAEMETTNFSRCQQRGMHITLAVMAAMPLFGLVGFEAMMQAIAGAAFGLIIWLMTYLPLRAHKSMYRLIAEMRDPLFIGPTLMLLVPDKVTGSTDSSSAMTSGQPGAAWGALIEALIRMLNNLRADHAVLLSREQLQILLSILQNPWRHNVRLKCAILKALEQIGDETALPVVEQLIRSRGNIEDLVTAAARECLPYLQQRAQQQQQAQTLLRASASAATNAPETLLRPASAIAANADPEQLLRPQTQPLS
jgi:hypothetical protein